MTEGTPVRLFRDFTNLLHSVSDREAFLRMLVVTATRVLNVTACSLILVERKSDRLFFHTATGESQEEVKQIKLKIGEGIAGWVVQRGEPALVPDVSKDTRWSSKVSSEVGIDTRSIACVPLISKGEVIGALEIIDRYDGQPVNEEDLERLTAFAEMATEALEESSRIGRAEKEIKSLKAQLAGEKKIIGESVVLRKAIETCHKVADSKATTLLTGESGTGKELFAKLIHESSPRREKPMVSVNCGALPEGLLERELFGNEKGAYTGADSRKSGLFEAADTGTIFLDEIGETTPAMQVKLLRVLQEGVFFRIGAQEPISVDVRVIAATNRDLKKLVEKNEFREDLYYRLDVIRVKLPPLRARKDDIPLLVDSFLKKIAKESGRQSKKMSTDAMRILTDFSWPGNVRQLENAIERAVIMSDGNLIRATDLPHELSKGASEIAPGSGLTLKDAQNIFKKNYIIQTLTECSGNQNKTAVVLDIQRTYLSRLIKELGIKEEMSRT